MIVTPTCRFCQGYLKSCGSQTGPYPYTKLIYHCVRCDSEQKYKYDATPLDFTFQITAESGNRYHILFDPSTMKLGIYQIIKDSNASWKPCLDIHLSEFPAWLRPDKLTEHRIKTMMVFS
jgi:hypothetical protein